MQIDNGHMHKNQFVQMGQFAKSGGVLFFLIKKA